MNFLERVSTGVSTFALFGHFSEVVRPAGIEPTSCQTPYDGCRLRGKITSKNILERQKVLVLALVLWQASIE